MPKITVVSPSNRKDGLAIVERCLCEQTFPSWEWIVIGEKKEGDFYNLNKAWNLAFNKAQGELIVSIVDYTEFAPDTLERLWNRYIENPITLISGVGMQYDKGELVWSDPRYQNKQIYPISPIDMEFRLASIPRRAIQAVGGMDEEYDKVVANSEKELCMRIASLGYLCLIDTNIVYKFYKHEDHGKEWDELFKESSKLLNQHYNEIVAGKRLYLDYVQR